MGNGKADEQTPPSRRRDPPLTRARARAMPSPAAAPPPATPPSPASQTASDSSADSSPVTIEQLQAAVVRNVNMWNLLEVERNALVQQNERAARLHVLLQNRLHELLQNTEHGPQEYELNHSLISQLHPMQGTNAHGHGLTDELESTGSINQAVNLEGRAAENTIARSIACSVCGSGPACMVFLPCKHLCACKPCGDNLSVCPICGSAKSKAIDLSE